MIRTNSINGVKVRTLKPREDDRGVFLEIFREEWQVGCAPVQWNVVHSKANVLRGVHVHAEHTDYLVLISGKMLMGLHDLRPEQEKLRRSEIISLDADYPLAITIPPGVCHGFYFLENSVQAHAVSSSWNLHDELGCRFDEPELRLDWPTKTPLMSKQDEVASTYQDMTNQFISACKNMQDGSDN